MTTTVEAGIRTKDDGAQWEFAQREARVMVACDEDFLAMHDANPDHAGIVFYEQQARGVGRVIEWLVLMHGAITPDEMRGRVQYI